MKYDKTEFAVVKAKNEDVIPIQRLIGGTVYYPNYFEIITSKYFTQKGPSFDAKRAFYHKLLAEKKDQVGHGYPFFTVLYYGDIRPDRSETKHIYDTTYDSNADVNGTKYVTFDILSLMSNMLNPWHTIYRADNLIELTKWETAIKDWEEYCTSEDKNFTTPNSILPFYSVDTMLLILKKQFSDVEIIENVNLYGFFEGNERIIEGVKDILYDRNNSFKLLVNKELEVGVNCEPKSRDVNYKLVAYIKKVEKRVNPMGLHSDSYEIRAVVERKDGASFEIYVNDEPNVIIKPLSNTEKRYPMNDSIHSMGTIIKNIQKILIPLMECYSVLTDGCVDNEQNVLSKEMVLSDRFRDHCISMILSNYKGVEKDRDALIKGIKKHNTVSEMYKYLVDQLWENAATEILIRQQIQKGIRKKDRVSYYYDKLLTLLIKSPFIGIAQSAVYKGIFNKACRLFITNSNNNLL